MPVTISGTTGIATPAVNTTGAVQAGSVNTTGAVQAASINTAGSLLAASISATGNIQAVGNVVGTGVCPAGVVLPFAISTPPTGWLACDGTIIPTSGSLQGVDAALLQTLRGLLGTTYGSTGQLPNLQGQFIRGLTTNLSTASRDPLSATRINQIGSVQNDAFQGHYHTPLTAGTQFLASGVNEGMVNGGSGYQARSTTGSPVTDTTNGIPRTATETRPVNIALLYCIKY